MRVCLHSCETEIMSIREAEGVIGLLLCIKDSDSLTQSSPLFWGPESHTQISYSLFISYHLPPCGITISYNMWRRRDQPSSPVENVGRLPVAFSLLRVFYLLQKLLHILAPALPLQSSFSELSEMLCPELKCSVLSAK